MVTVEALNELSKRVLDAAFAVHTEAGPGLLESTYLACLKDELEIRGMLNPGRGSLSGGL